MLVGVVAFAAGLALDCGLSAIESTVRRDTQDRVLQKGVKLPVDVFDDAATLDLVHLATGEGARSPFMIFSETIALASSLLSVVSLSAVLVAWSPAVAALLLFTPLPTLITGSVLAKARVRLELGRAELTRRRQYLADLVFRERSFRELLSAGAFGQVAGRARDLGRELWTTDRHFLRSRILLTASVGLLSVAAATVAMALAGLRAATEGEVGAFVGTIASVGAMQAAVQGAYAHLGVLMQHKAMTRAADTFYAMPERAIEPPNLTCGTLEATPGAAALVAREVTFKYPSGEEPAVNRVSFALAKGASLAIIGANGSGKSTLVRLLSGQYKPQSGAVEWFGRPGTVYSEAERSRIIGVLQQDFMQYDMTLRENVTLGCPDHHPGDDEVLDALRRAGADDLVQSRGLDAPLGSLFSGSTRLSGGEWQRIALARTLIRNPGILILDEPTAAMDSMHSQVIQELLTDPGRSCSIVIVTHDVGLARLADQIMVLHEGACVELGSHLSLLHRDGLYRALALLHADAERSTRTG